MLLVHDFQIVLVGGLPDGVILWFIALQIRRMRHNLTPLLKVGNLAQYVISCTIALPITVASIGPALVECRLH